MIFMFLKIKNFILIALIALSCVSQGSVNLPLNTTKNKAEKSDFATYPQVNYGHGKHADQIRRGEYLVKMGDCIACHTDVKGGGKPFAGNYPIDTPFGIIYTPNITSDKRTGIGAWTNKAFIKAVREGVRPNHQFLFPALPFLWYNKVSDKDLIDIKAYLDSTPAVYTPTRRKNTIPFPLNIRFLQLGWRMMFFYGHRDRFVPDPAHSKQWNRGAYIVQGLGHCGMCHTPANFIGGPKRKYALTGSSISGHYAPNITSKNFKNTSVKEIHEVFTMDRLVGGGKVEFGMLEDNHDSLSYLNPYDLDAIAIYLKSVVSKQPAVKAVGHGEDAAGEATYNQYCFACHKMGSGGAPKLGDVNQWKPLLAKGLPMLYDNAIHGLNGMPAKGTCISCSDEQIKQAVRFMVHQVKGKQAPVSRAAKPITPDESKLLYETHCAMCHAQGVDRAPMVGDAKAWAPIANKGFKELFYGLIDPATGQLNHGVCPTCTDPEVIAMLKYMLNQSTNKDYSLW
jgi:cytochrome c5